MGMLKGKDKIPEGDDQMGKDTEAKTSIAHTWSLRQFMYLELSL
jgi:hypothetical protein